MKKTFRPRTIAKRIETIQQCTSLADKLTHYDQAVQHHHEATSAEIDQLNVICRSLAASLVNQGPLTSGGILYTGHANGTITRSLP